MLNGVDSAVQEVATNAYALFIGLLLTALPAVIWIAKQLRSLGKFAYGLVKLGAKEKRRRYKLRQALGARHLLDLTQFRLTLIYHFVVSIFFLISCIIYMILIIFMTWFLAPTVFLALINAESRGSTIAISISFVILAVFYQVIKRTVEMGGIVSARRKLKSRNKRQSKRNLQNVVHD